MIITLLAPELHEPSVIEEYFSRALGLVLVTMGVLVVLLTGSVPLTSSFSDCESSRLGSLAIFEEKGVYTCNANTIDLTATSAGVTTELTDPKAPYAVPTLTITTLYHSAAAFLTYARWNSTGSSGFMLGSVFSGLLSAVGLWCVLFGSSNGRISRKTGADKRTSGFPFGNKEADKRKSGKKGL